VWLCLNALETTILGTAGLYELLLPYEYKEKTKAKVTVERLRGRGKGRGVVIHGQVGYTEQDIPKRVRLCCCLGQLFASEEYGLEFQFQFACALFPFWIHLSVKT
jgi:hypothetical protein